jgi:L-ascorbate metabolism protein UlaG (beta-lactamase superfamily)
MVLGKTPGVSSSTTTLDWYGCATFRLTIGEIVVFLDAYIDRVPGAPGTGLRADDIDRADWIVIGHSHFDHLWGAERIAQNTGATVIGSYETCRILAAYGVPNAQLIPVSGGERVRIADDVVVGVFPSLHSCVWSQTAMTGSDAVCIGDLGLTHQEREARMGDLMQHFASLGADVLSHLQESNQGAKGDGGALVFVFETPGGSILYQDTSGHWSGILHDLRPDFAILAAAGRGNVDGEPIQGTLAQFVARQAWLVKARNLALCHHDDWLPGFSTATDVGPIRAELARWLPNATLHDLAYLDGHQVFD